MEVDLAQLADDVRDGLAAYEIPERHPDALGTPLSPEWYKGRLAEMRAALVNPRWIRMRDQDAKSGLLVILDVVLVADDGDGSLVVFDPQADGEFALAVRDPDQVLSRGINVVSCGVRGDAVGCFLSR